MQNITEQSWKRCLDFISHNIDEKPFSTWFSPIRFDGFRGKQLILKVPSHFFYEYIEEHFITILRAAVEREFGDGITIGYRIETDSTNNISQSAVDNATRVPYNQKKELTQTKRLRLWQVWKEQRHRS